jgi:hypothetical protein
MDGWMLTRSDESMAEPFMELPSKVRRPTAHSLTRQNEFPDYYETIKHPMSLEMVRDKLDRGQYTTLGQVTTDMGTIWNNAKRCE